MSEFVDRRHSPFPSHLEPYRAYLQQRWEQGEVMIKRLWQEIQQQGFTGSYSSLWKFLHTWPLPAGMVSSASSVSFVPATRSMPTTRTPRQTMWLLLCETARASRNGWSLPAGVVPSPPVSRRLLPLRER